MLKDLVQSPLVKRPVLNRKAPEAAREVLAPGGKQDRFRVPENEPEDAGPRACDRDPESFRDHSYISYTRL